MGRMGGMQIHKAVDMKGNGAIHPDLHKETPYVAVKLKRAAAER